MIETALEDVQDRKSGWSEADLTRVINAALPGYLDTPDGVQVAQLLDQLTAEALRYVTTLDAPRLGTRTCRPSCGSPMALPSIRRPVRAYTPRPREVAQRFCWTADKTGG